MLQYIGRKNRDLKEWESLSGNQEKTFISLTNENLTEYHWVLWTDLAPEMWLLGGKVETKVLLCRCTLAPECSWQG